MSLKVKVTRDKKWLFFSLLAPSVQFKFGKTSLAATFNVIFGLPRLAGSPIVASRKSLDITKAANLQATQSSCPAVVET